MKVRVNPDQTIANIAREAVRANDGYCPCKIDKNNDTKCMCKEFREAQDRGEVGVCECGLYDAYEEHPIVCLCGSTRFKDEFLTLARVWTKNGYIVLMPHVYEHAGDPFDPADKPMLDSIHHAKIALADIVFIVNVDGYIGESTSKEIEYATAIGKEIRYLEDIEK